MSNLQPDAQRDILRLDLRFSLPATAGEAFRYLTEVENWPTYWTDFVRFTDPACLKWSDPGDRIRLVIRMFRCELEIELELKEFEPERRIIYYSRQRGIPEARHERIFTPQADGCEYRVIVECERRRGLVGGFDSVVIKPSLERTIRKSVGKFRSALE